MVALLYGEKSYSSFGLGVGDWTPLFITMVGVDVCHWCDEGGGGGGADDEAAEVAEVAEAGETEEVTHCGEFSSPVVDNEVVGEKTCGGGSSLLCLILHWSSSTYIKCRLDWI